MARVARVLAVRPGEGRLVGLVAATFAVVEAGRGLGDVGADTLVVPYMTDAHRNAEGWKAAVANFNRYAERLKKAGLGFAYHNHDFEFILKPGGTSLFDTLIADADPALVQIELDLFWAVAAGEDPKAIIRRLARSEYGAKIIRCVSSRTTTPMTGRWECVTSSIDCALRGWEYSCSEPR